MLAAWPWIRYRSGNCHGRSGLSVQQPDRKAAWKVTDDFALEPVDAVNVDGHAVANLTALGRLDREAAGGCVDYLAEVLAAIRKDIARWETRWNTRVVAALNRSSYSTRSH